MGEPRNALATHRNEHAPPERAGSPTLLLLGFLLLILLGPSAFAAAPAIPDTLVAQHDTVITSGGLWATTDNLTWRLSSQDPDQLNGSLNYQVWENDSSIVGWHNVSGIGRFWNPVPHRAGWVYYTPGIGSFSQTDSTYHYNLTVADLSGVQSIGSCAVSLDGLNVGSHDQCGNITIQPPPGLSASFNTTLFNATFPEPAIDYRWPLSPDDPHSSAIGDYTYQVNASFLLLGGSNYPYNFSAPFGNLPFLNGSVMLTLSNVYEGNYSHMPQLAQSVQTFVMAKDPQTHQWSAPSCAVINKWPAVGPELQNCGSLTNSVGVNFGFNNTALPAFGDGSPSFPAIDLPSVSSSTGLDMTALGYILGAVLIAGCAMAGYALAKNTGATIAPVFGLALTGLMNLWPLWLIVLIFLAIVGLATLLLTRGRS